jgi:crotonobetainyl-CoA:carnitine CoA-transferase CaiB-like acyl-CoA transferase
MSNSSTGNPCFLPFGTIANMNAEDANGREYIMHALEGVKVLGLTVAQMATKACCILADLGADVIKVEPIQGEYTRPTTRDYDRYGINAFFLAHNRNMRGIALNYNTARGKEIIYKLVEKSDVFISNQAPGTIERAGFSYEDLIKINPRLIYARGSGFGAEKGPMKDWQSVDIIAQAWSGLLHQNDHGQVPVGTAVIDDCGGIAMALGVVAGLYARDRTGKGQEITASLLQAALYLLSMEYISHWLSGKDIPQSGRGHSMVKGVWQTFPCKDRAIVMGGVGDKPWKAMCQVLGIEELISDPRFATAEMRGKHLAQLSEILDKIFITKDADEWLPKLLDAGVRVAPVLSLNEILDHPVIGEQIKANEFVTTVEQNGHEVKIPAPLIRMSDTPTSIRRPSFSVGEHTNEVLLELGYSWEDIAQMVRDSAI